MSIRVDSSVLRGQRGALNRFIDRMRRMDDQQVVVGVPQGKKHTSSSADGSTQQVDMALIAAVLNYGSRSRNIPARGFIEPSINKNMAKYQRLMAREASGVLLQRATLNQALQRVGMLMAADVQDYMVTHTGFAPLAEQTIKRKGSSKPLIDSGQVRQAITYKVE